MVSRVRRCKLVLSLLSTQFDDVEFDSFMQHPWSSIPDTFFNLEGAGAGG